MKYVHSVAKSLLSSLSLSSIGELSERATLSTKIEAWAFFSFILLLVWLPIPLGSNRDWAWAIGAVCICTTTLLLFIAYRGQLPYARLKPYVVLIALLVAFQVWVGLQTLPLPSEILAILSPAANDVYQSIGASYGYLSLDVRASQLSALKGLSYVVFLLNTIWLITTPKRLVFAVVALVLSGTFQAFYGALLLMSDLSHSPIFDYPIGQAATGSFVYKNHFANYLTMTACLGVGLIIGQMHTDKASSLMAATKRLISGLISPKMLVRLCVVIIVIGLILSRSRMGNSAFIFAVTAGTVLSLLFYKHRPPAFNYLIVSILTIDTLLIGAWFGIENIKQKLLATSLSDESRDQVVLWALDMIRDYPLTGTGMGSFYSVFPSYSRGATGFYDHAHNDYIQFMAEAGVPATFLLASAVCIAFAYAIKALRVRSNNQLKGIGIGSCMAIIAMLIHISVDFNLQPSANALTFIFVLYLANASAKLPSPRSRQHRKRNKEGAYV